MQPGQLNVREHVARGLEEHVGAVNAFALLHKHLALPILVQVQDVLFPGETVHMLSRCFQQFRCDSIRLQVAREEGFNLCKFNLIVVEEELSHLLVGHVVHVLQVVSARKKATCLSAKRSGDGIASP
jgi:hypothetical protein